MWHINDMEVMVFFFILQPFPSRHLETVMWSSGWTSGLLCETTRGMHLCPVPKLLSLFLRVQVKAWRMEFACLDRWSDSAEV